MFRKIVTDPIELSSTQIRKAVANGDSISAFVPPEVEEYIKENRLYE
jgi:nicotinic acid mononucleotide adenylyltransferase